MLSQEDFSLEQIPVCFQENQRLYSSYFLKQVLSFINCKPHHAKIISQKVFSKLQKYPSTSFLSFTSLIESGNTTLPSPEFVKLSKNEFFQWVCQELITLGYGRPLLFHHLTVAWDIKDSQQSICILLGGTSGCGKSTLATLLARRLGITSVLSTDNIRHLLRNFVSKEESPVLWSSSYHAGELVTHEEGNSAERQVIKGYEKQSTILYKDLESIIAKFEARKQSLIIEGVHLSPSTVDKLMQKYPSCIPFCVYISNESKHIERFAIRAKYMTLDPRHNKYMKYFANIRIIQSHVCRGADSLKIPKVNNTNIDRSLVMLHRTVLNFLYQFLGSKYSKSSCSRLELLSQEYTKIRSAILSSKEMLQKLQSRKRGLRYISAIKGSPLQVLDRGDIDDFEEDYAASLGS